MEYILIFISAIFVNNIVLSQFLGICPFLGVSKKVETAMGMSAAVAFVLTIATIVTFLIQKFVLDVFGLGYLQTITFILVIAGLVQMVEIILKKVSPALYQAFHKMENITSEEPLEAYDVVGPICESSDVFGKAIDLNKVKRGDLIALRSAGAYGEIMASSYNCRELPQGYTSDELV